MIICKNTITVNDLSKKLRNDAVPIKFNGLDRAENWIAVSPNLMKNIDFVTIINNLENNQSTEGAYLLINTSNPSLPIIYDSVEKSYIVRSGFENHPVVGVPWLGAKAICELLGGRLLKEREWELCASGCSPDRIYPWGNSPPTAKLANFAEQVGSTTPVASYPPGPNGLYDFSGNVEEWCDDWSDSSGSHLEKTVKGGGWSKGGYYLKIKSRRSKWYAVGTSSIGFRVAWDIR